MFKNYKIYFLAFFFLVSIVSIYLYFDKKKLYTTPIGGWSEIKSKIEEEFKDNQDLKRAALQLGLAFQKSIDYPEEAFNAQKQIANGLSCLYAILDKQKNESFKVYDIGNNIRDISVSNSKERIKRYIRFNSNLSGNMFLGSESDLTKCNFKTKISNSVDDK